MAAVSVAYPRQGHTRNVTSIFRSADDAQLADGLAWYATAADVAEQVAILTGRPFDVAVGVIAATSPRMGWGPNVKLASRILQTGDTSRGYLKNGLRSAARILEGEDPLAVLTARKTANFYRAIVSRGADGIVIDRHALDIAHNFRIEGDRPSPTERQYDAVAEHYRRAAVVLAKQGFPGITASQVQAVTWLTWRRRYWGAGAFDLRGDLALQLEGVLA